MHSIVRGPKLITQEGTGGKKGEKGKRTRKNFTTSVERKKSGIGKERN